MRKNLIRTATAFAATFALLVLAAACTEPETPTPVPAPEPTIMRAPALTPSIPSPPPVFEAPTEEEPEPAKSTEPVDPRTVAADLAE